MIVGGLLVATWGGMSMVGKAVRRLDG
jgi:hypothetical protein